MAPGRLSPSGSFLSGPCDPTESGSLVVLPVAVGTWIRSLGSLPDLRRDRSAGG